VERWITDNEPSVRYPTYTRANAGEVMPDPVSPLTASMGIMAAGEAGWRDAYNRLGTFQPEEFEDDRPNTIGCFGGYLYLNMSLTRIYGVRCPGMSPEIVDFTYFGEMPGIPPYEEERRPTDESPDGTARLAEWLQWIMTADDLPELLDDQAEVEEVIARRPDLAAATDEELVARARAMVPLYRRLFARHIEISGASGVAIGTVAGICQAIGDPTLTMRLVGAAGGVDSAAPSHALWDMSRMVARSPVLTAAFDRGVHGLLDRLRSANADDSVKLLVEIDSFLERHGCRGPNEWELRSLVWGIRPDLPLAAVDRMRLASDGQSPAQQADKLRADREAVTDQVRQALAGDDEALAQFEAGARASLLFLAGRERTKTTNIRLVHEMRMPLRELGRRMVAAGHLDTVEQVFMLLDQELEAFLADPASFTSVVREREREYAELFELEPLFIIFRTVPPVSSWPRRDRRAVDHVGPGTSLAGIPGCPGRATGKARVVLDPSDPTALGPGDVLVAPITDPAWTPLFVPAAAVVVDVGAQVSHAVIVSRELGIPCVVSVTDATRKIPDGATVTVDGTTGTVTVH